MSSDHDDGRGVSRRKILGWRAEAGHADHDNILK